MAPPWFSSKDQRMVAYAVSEVEALDGAQFARYRELAAASIARHGGHYLVRGAEPEVIEGQPSGGRRIVIVEFPMENGFASGTGQPTTPRPWRYATAHCAAARR